MNSVDAIYLEYWNIGILEYWNTGILGNKSGKIILSL